MSNATTTAVTEHPERQSSYSYDELLKCASGDVFGMKNGKLPQPPMLMTDRVTSITEDGGKYGKGEVQAELDIRPDLWFFDCHFAGDPVMPGCLGLDALWQLVGFYLVWAGYEGRGRALGVLDEARLQAQEVAVAAAGIGGDEHPVAAPRRKAAGRRLGSILRGEADDVRAAVGQARDEA